jgi:asparaginyl-tRNA synthetase
MVEPEMAFCDLAEDVNLAEAFVREVTARVLADCAEDMAFFDKRIAPGRLELLRHVAETPFQRMSYTEAIEALHAGGKNFEYPPEWGADLQTEHERYLTEEHLGAPIIVTDYPKAIKAFYMYENDGGETVRAMDVLVPGVGEIIGGSQREDREEVLRRRIAECGLNAEDYWWYLELRRHGGAPHSGFGLGFERLVQFLTGMQNIRDVIPFPRVPGSAEF